MTTVLVSVTHPHRWETRRVVLEETPGGPCQRPIPVSWLGQHVRFIDCSRRLTPERQCPACRTDLATVHLTTGETRCERCY
jgi:hypothetical protein